MACRVRSPVAPSQGRTLGACPPRWRQGWKWSETAIVSRPTRSACCAYSTSFRGPNCSAEALYPYRISIVLSSGSQGVGGSHVHRLGGCEELARRLALLAVHAARALDAAERHVWLD